MSGMPGTARAGVRAVPQPFESGHLGGPVVRLAFGDEWSPGELARVLDRDVPDEAALVSARVPAGDAAAAAALEAAGFRCVEELVTL
jgi:hypothetical protein